MLGLYFAITCLRHSSCKEPMIQPKAMAAALKKLPTSTDGWSKFIICFGSYGVRTILVIISYFFHFLFCNCNCNT